MRKCRQVSLAHRDSLTNYLDNKFDGDCLNTMILLDNYMAESMADLAPHKSALNLETVREISSDMLQPKPVVATVSNYMLKPPEPITTDAQRNFMMSLAA